MVEIPDEYGLSSDSLRGSHQYVAPHLVDAQDSRDPMTGRPNPRAKLSANERLALRNTGMLVDEDGYEQEPEPIVPTAPVPTVQPRVRPQDRAPAGETKPTPPVQMPVDDGESDKAWPPDDVALYGTNPVAPYGASVPTPQPSPEAERAAQERQRQVSQSATYENASHVDPSTEPD